MERFSVNIWAVVRSCTLSFEADVHRQCERCFDGALHANIGLIFKPSWRAECVCVCPFWFYLAQQTKALTTSENRRKTSGRESGEMMRTRPKLSLCRPTQSLFLLLCHCILKHEVSSKPQAEKYCIVFTVKGVFLKVFKPEGGVIPSTCGWHCVEDILTWQHHVHISYLHKYTPDHKHLMHWVT